MICPKCKTQYDVYNAVEKEDNWFCPDCNIELEIESELLNSITLRGSSMVEICECGNTAFKVFKDEKFKNIWITCVICNKQKKI